jgi:hypothetical protein
MLQMILDQIFKEHSEHPDMCDEQEPETQLSSTNVTASVPLQLRKHQMDLAGSAAMSCLIQRYQTW